MRSVGQTLGTLGLVLEQAGDTPGAARRFEEARGILIDLGGRAPAADWLAGLARCALAQGHLDEARRHVTDLWTYLQEHGTRGMAFPVWAFQTCADIFDALNDPEQARHRRNLGGIGSLSLSNPPVSVANVRLVERAFRNSF